MNNTLSFPISISLISLMITIITKVALSNFVMLLIRTIVERARGEGQSRLQRVEAGWSMLEHVEAGWSR